jgi:hypothetical protein
MKKILNILILLVLYIAAYPQQFIFRGYAKDSIGNYAVSNVNINVEGSSVAATTNDSGFFSFKFPTLNFKLSISHLNYKKQSLSISNNKEICILLSPKITELKTVTINADPIVNITKKLPIYVIDYLIIDQKILLLAYNHKKLRDTRLFLIDHDANIVLEKKIERANELYRDCFDEIYYLNKEEAVKIKINPNEIAISDKLSRKDFDETLKTVDFKINDNIYFHTLQYQNFILKLHYINLFDEEKEKQTILTFADSSKIDIFEREYNVFFYTRRARFYGFSVTTIYNNLNVFRSCQPLDWVDRHGRFTPINVIIQKLKDNIIVFNPIENKMEVYDKDGRILHKADANFLTEKYFKEKLIKSEEEEKIYAVFMKNAIIQLKEIDITSGKTINQINIPDFPYIERIKISNHQVYFLYKRKINEEYKQLYTMPLI